MKNISRLILVVLSIVLIFSGCSLAIPQDLTYTQIADPTLEHIISDNSIIYIPESDVKGKIFLDPGHGFSDPGVLGPNYEEDGVCESFLVFELSKKILSVLVSQGYEVMMCREADYDIRQEKDMYKVQPEDRTKMANDWGADFFLSIHINSYEDDPSTNYLLAAYTTKSSPDDATMEAFCTYILNGMTGTIGERTTNIEKNKPATGYYVNTRANMPSILLEIGFITNPTDYENFKNTSWQQVAAQGISNGIINLLGSPEYAAYKASIAQ